MAHATLERIDLPQTHPELYSLVHTTPIERAVFPLANNQMLDAKLETEQVTGSFKARGAAQAVLASSEQHFVTASAGSHGAALAYAASRAGKDALVFSPESTPESKQQRIRDFGRLAMVGNEFAAAEHAAITYAQHHDAQYVPPFDDAHIVAGQKTVSDEILAEYPADTPLTIFASIGGGGQLAGALAATAESPHVRVVGVQFSSNTSAEASRYHDSLQEINGSLDLRCEGSAVRKIGRLPFALMQQAGERLDFITVGPRDVGHSIAMEYQRRETLADAYHNYDIDPYEYFPETTGFIAETGARLYAEQGRGVPGNWVAIRSGSNRDPEREDALLEAYRLAQPSRVGRVKVWHGPQVAF